MATVGMKSQAVAVDFVDYGRSVAEVLDATGARTVLAEQERVVLKPNLVNAKPHPVTTPVALCEALVREIRESGAAEVVIAEGCGEPSRTTREIFEKLGYADMARRLGVELVDLNEAPCRSLSNGSRPFFPEMVLPELCLDSFLISLPVLKAHSLAGFTGAIKNLVGLAPPSVYSGAGGSWRKAVFHQDMQQSIMDLASYRAPDFSLLDASVGLADHHLGGRTCSPPVGKLVAGFDAWAVDRMGAEMLGLDWRMIPYLERKPG